MERRSRPRLRPAERNAIRCRRSFSERRSAIRRSCITRCSVIASPLDCLPPHVQAGVTAPRPRDSQANQRRRHLAAASRPVFHLSESRHAVRDMDEDHSSAHAKSCLLIRADPPPTGLGDEVRKEDVWRNVKRFGYLQCSGQAGASALLDLANSCARQTDSSPKLVKRPTFRAPDFPYRRFHFHAGRCMTRHF